RLLKDAVDEISTAIRTGMLKDTDHERYYTLLVVKKAQPKIATSYSPASTPIWSDLLPENSKVSQSVAAQANNVIPIRKLKVVAMILAYNCGRMLSRALERIPKYLVDDIIVMDDGSSDNTSDVAGSLGLKVFR